MVKETVMQNPKRQAGMTMWGMLFVLGTLAFTLFLFFKLLPPYLSDFKIKGALESLTRQPDAGSLTLPEVKEAIRKRLEIDSADDLFDLNKILTVVPMAFNVSALISFDHAIEVRGPE
jgi:hypothetical protein